MARMEAFDFNSNILSKDAPFGQQPPIFCWSPDTVMKAVIANEAFEPHTMAVVSSQTNIPVPNVRRYIHWRSTLDFHGVYPRRRLEGYLGVSEYA